MLNEFLNCTYFNGEDFVLNQDIKIKQSHIASISNSGFTNASSDFVVPGFIDLQIYGAAGKLFSADPSVESLTQIENELLSKGTTGFLICLATNTPEIFNECITIAKEHHKIARNCMGLHLEGPFLNPKRRGAHVEKFIRKASLDEIKALLDFGDGLIKMMTIAPELQDDDVIQYLLDHHVVLSLGHSDASFAQATAAYDMGVQSTTHLFNAMSPLQHRAPGIPAAVFNHKNAHASIIADGLHVDFEIVKLSHKLLNDRLFLITDAVTECTIGPYQHQLVDDKFILPDGTLSGSSLTMLQAIKNCVAYCDISLADALKMSSSYPAKLIGEEVRLGKIEEGYQADLLVLDKELNLKKVISKGVEY